MFFSFYWSFTQQTSVLHIGLGNSHAYWKFIFVGIDFVGFLSQKKRKKEKDEVRVRWCLIIYALLLILCTIEYGVIN